MTTTDILSIARKAVPRAQVRLAADGAPTLILTAKTATVLDRHAALMEAALIDAGYRICRGTALPAGAGIDPEFWVYNIAVETDHPIDPTTEDIEAIRLGAYNDRTRRIERCGIRLSHDEADALGALGCDWLVSRLKLHLVTDDRGTMFLPEVK